MEEDKKNKYYFDNLNQFENKVDEIYEERRVKTLFYNHPYLMYSVIDENSVFQDVNKGWENALGYTEEEFIGKTFESFLHPDDIKLSDDIYAFYVAKKIQGMEMFVNRYRKKDGTYVKIQWVAGLHDEVAHINLFTCFPIPNSDEGIIRYINGYKPFNWK
jgi:PAS domain S-box-containing protein